jgi:5,5'-dehydrodivanillate O-demethylase
MLGRSLLPINWLQIMENSLDPVHTEWLHGHHYEFLKEQEGVKVAISAHHKKIDFKEFEYGMTKHRLLEGHSEDGDDWKIGHPIIFPNTLAVGNGDETQRYFSFQIRVPVDDENTLHLWYNAYVPPAGKKVPAHLLENFTSTQCPLLTRRVSTLLTTWTVRDIMAWISQGTIADRSQENFGRH